ncbi:thioesterase family protein [Fodinicola feengrottensis]|uniref:Thioesterase family protein n=1 Tax=Fodinicola feengrottensis TaxID=435914 RepID=A0ABN2IC75_9ACTN|nr:thioesterase family protein [Fodinicola feengrottensis]
MTQIEGALERATAVEETGDGRYRVQLDPDWSVVGMLNGGYLNLPMARAAAYASPHPHVVAITTDYLSAPAAGEAEVRVDTLKTGKTVAYHRTTLVQNDVVTLSSSVITSRLSDEPADTYAREVPLPLVRPEDCRRVPVEIPGGLEYGLMRHVDLRMTPESEAAMTQSDGSLAVSGWVRAADGSPTDPYLALLAVDALPPVTRTIGRWGWAPTVQLSTYLRAVPAPGWLRAYMHGDFVSDGWFDEECTVYDENGQLVAQSRQLARVPR